jgi:hypothetical protein
MKKEDWYFVISTVLGLLALVTTDWKGVLGKVAMPTSQLRQIVILALICGSLLMSGMGWYRLNRLNHMNRTTEISIHFNDQSQEVIYGHTYFNESVELDHKLFDHCVFENAKLVYHGLGPWGFKEATFKGTTIFASDNDGIKMWIGLIEFAKQANIDSKYSEPLMMDDKGNMSPLPPAIRNDHGKPNQK